MKKFVVSNLARSVMSMTTPGPINLSWCQGYWTFFSITDAPNK